MNFFHGRLISQNNGLAKVDAGPLGVLETALTGEVPALGASVSLAIRPEKLHLSRHPMRTGNVIAGTVSAEAYFGDRSHYYVKVGGVDRLIAVAYQNVDRTLENSNLAGTSVWLSWPPEAAILLSG
jgi:ABC-type Fe3+/spermidine/putrescine transport system ATPase subunit